ATYQWLIDMSDDPDLNDGLAFLREREIVHSQRFREAVEILKEERDRKKVF
ncbi:manganese catalase family protein, partial [Bacillus subtilis]